LRRFDIANDQTDLGGKRPITASLYQRGEIAAAAGD
jgi:hypothetical protein